MVSGKKQICSILASGPESTSVAAWYLTDESLDYLIDEKGVTRQFSHHEPAAFVDSLWIEDEIAPPRMTLKSEPHTSRVHLLFRCESA